MYEPGTTPAYSNWATALTGYMIERVSGESFDDYCDKHIFAPLGMTNSTMRQPLPAALAGQMASGYKPGQEAGKFEIVGPAPAGSLSSTGTDMAKFMIAHLDQGKGLLSPEIAATMHNSPLDKVNPVSLLPPLNRMELGFFETNINGREVIGHLGDTEFFHTSLHLLMKEGVGIYFSFNSGGREGQVQTLRWSLFEDFADRYFPASYGGGCTTGCENGRRTRRPDGRQLAGQSHVLEQPAQRAAAHQPDQGGCRAERRAADSGAARLTTSYRVSGKRSRRSSGARRAGTTFSPQRSKMARWSAGASACSGPSWCSIASRRIVRRAGSCRLLPSALAFCC